ncbi:MAG: hypothetical protein IPL67_20065 [Ignavibacteria bacterium]|nr:hypothetical protein [Ignavibacteria bacterium]
MVHYGVNAQFNTAHIISKITDPVTGLDRHFKVNTANEFLFHIHCKTPPKVLTQEQLTAAGMSGYMISTS